MGLDRDRQDQERSLHGLGAAVGEAGPAGAGGLLGGSDLEGPRLWIIKLTMNVVMKLHLVRIQV